MLSIPLALAAFTHLWNVVGFPPVYVDEDDYLRRAMQVLEGGGTLDPTTRSDHPYFGQIFLAIVFKLVGYPNSLNPHPGDVHSIETLYLVPRILMGLLAILDTFLVYKIAEWRYNRNVALIASILFAVMPLTWFLRKVYLDSIQLPFLLSSILFAVYPSSQHLNTRTEHSDNNNKSTQNKNDNYNKQVLTTLLSGIFLGLAIFTKIPGLILIPLVGYLLFTNKGRSWKKLALWLAPVILIPLIWPVHTLLYGQFDRWVDGVLWEATRLPRPLLDSIAYVLQIDPVLIILGMAGMVYCIVKRKRDFLPLLWIAPFFILFYLLNYFSPLHIIYLIPAFCIASAILIVKILDTIGRIFRNELKLAHITRYFTRQRTSGEDKLHSQLGTENKVKPSSRFAQFQYLLFITAAVIVISGLAYTAHIISEDVTLPHFTMYAAIVKDISNIYGSGHKNNEKITVIGPGWMEGYYWIPKDVFGKNVHFLTLPIESLPDSRFILIADKSVKDRMLTQENSNDIRILQELYKMSKVVGEYNDQRVNTLPSPTSMVDQREVLGNYSGKIQIRTNLFNQK